MKQKMIHKRENILKVLFLLFVFVNACFVQTTHAENGRSDVYLVQQNITCSGTVSDEGGEPIPGVSVIVKGTAIGTITDIDGNYTLSDVSDDAILVFSFIGMRNKEVAINGQIKINVTLEQDMIGLDEVVAVGYGVTKKMDLTGASSNISTDDLNQGAVTNPLQQMAGRAVGVNITQVGSEPGSAPSVRIRGITSLSGGNDPLVVIDGIQGDMSMFNQLAPSEIENVDILKDASATAIYGSRGAPGVIIVTTKKAKAGHKSIEYSGSYSVDMLANKLDFYSADEYRAQMAAWQVPGEVDHGADTDWYDILTQVGNTQNHTVAFGGGTGDFNYRASVSAILQEGVVINSSNNNYIARLTATQKGLDDKLTLTLNMNNSIRQNVGSPSGVGRAQFTGNLISNAYFAKPTDPVYDVDGSYYYDENVFQYLNPYAVAQEVENDREEKSMFTSLRADLEIVEGLKAGWFGSWRKVSEESGYYASPKSTLYSAMDKNGIANVRSNFKEDRLMDISLNYDKTFGKHKIGALAVYEWQRNTYQGHFAQSKGFINDVFTYNKLEAGSEGSIDLGDMTSYKNDRTVVSVLGRVNYTFNEKYLLTASIRRDGASVFGDNYKWGNFPSASFAWRVSEEGFMQSQDLVSNLKLRVGYGVTGNQQGLYPQASLLLVEPSGTLFFGGEEIKNFRINQNANPDLRWETRKQLNLGVDYGLFNGKVYGAVDVFSATTDNLLFSYDVPRPPYPNPSMYANVGSLVNEGIEFAVNYIPIKNGDWEVNLGANFSLLRTEVETLSGKIGETVIDTEIVSWGSYNAFLKEGDAIGTFYILQNAGKDESNSELVADINNDGTIDTGIRSEDRYKAGQALPKYNFAFTPSVKYKNFDLSMVWRGAGGNKIFNYIKKSFSTYENLGKSNLLKTSSNTGLSTTMYNSDLWLEDGDFVRFENLSLGYTFNTDRLKYISKMRLSLTGNNLAVFTKYTGLDPEVDVSGGTGSGADVGIYPRTRSFSLGLNVTF